jgi:hypothetical protein
MDEGKERADGPLFPLIAPQSLPEVKSSQLRCDDLLHRRKNPLRGLFRRARVIAAVSASDSLLPFSSVTTIFYNLSVFKGV